MNTFDYFVLLDFKNAAEISNKNNDKYQLKFCEFLKNRKNEIHSFLHFMRKKLRDEHQNIQTNHNISTLINNIALAEFFLGEWIKSNQSCTLLNELEINNKQGAVFKRIMMLEELMNMRGYGSKMMIDAYTKCLKILNKACWGKNSENESPNEKVKEEGKYSSSSHHYDSASSGKNYVNYTSIIVGQRKFPCSQNSNLTHDVEFQILNLLIATNFFLRIKDFKNAFNKLNDLSSVSEGFIKTIRLQDYDKIPPKQNHQDLNNEKYYFTTTGHTLYRYLQFIVKNYKGYLSFLQKDYQKAMQSICSNIVVLGSGASATPEDAEIALKEYFKMHQYANLGICNLKMGNYISSIQLLTKALSMAELPHGSKFQADEETYQKRELLWRHELIRLNAKAKIPFLIFTLGQALLKKDKVKEAIVNFEQISKAYADNYRYWYRLGTGYLKKYKQMALVNSQKSLSDMYFDFDEKVIVQPTQDVVDETRNTKKKK